MNSSGSINYVFRKYPFIRILCGIVVISLFLGIYFFVVHKKRVVPYIDYISPSVGLPGDVVLIYGKNFGNVRDMNYVEFAGNKLTASSYISWSDECIKIVLPSNIQDGLVVVGVNNQISNPALFANEIDIPVPVETEVQITKPLIVSTNVPKGKIGDVISIIGNNFGDVRNSSKVLFTIDYNNKLKDSDIKSIPLLTENMIPVNEKNGYVYWSNTEIKVRIPDGATTGVIIVSSEEQMSEPVNFTVDTQVGRKNYINKKIYLLQYTADVDDIVTNDVSTITFRCPVPYTTASQPEVEITEVVPEPILVNYQNNLIHQITKSRNNTPKTVFRQTFVLPVYEIKSEINTDRVVALGNSSITEELNDFISADEFVPSDNEKVIALAKEIVKKEKNPYRQAKLVYQYLCKNVILLQSVRKPEADPLDLIETKTGDAYDFAVIYTALLRALGIPCATDSGILINLDMTSVTHWWAEFYIHGAGWIPVDVALGAGLNYTKWPDDPNDEMYYFGNLDSHHIQFSKGWTKLKPFSKDNTIVQHPRSFALQSIWEEASAETAKYSSYWSVPVVKGIY